MFDTELQNSQVLAFLSIFMMLSVVSTVPFNTCQCSENLVKSITLSMINVNDSLLMEEILHHLGCLKPYIDHRP